MFAADTESILQPIFTLGIAGLIGAVIVLSIAVSIFYMVYMQAKKDRSEH